MGLASVLATGRRFAEARMTDTCTVRRSATLTTDPVTGDVAQTPGALVYGPSVAPHFGRCRFKDPSTRSGTPDAGGVTVTVQAPEVHVPAGAFTPEVGMVVTGVASQVSPLVPGRVMRVTGLPVGSQTTALRLPVEEWA